MNEDDTFTETHNALCVQHYCRTFARSMMTKRNAMSLVCFCK